jgi:coenzyme F420-reducing hydrogenase delta subunit
MDIDDLDKLFTSIGGLKDEERIFLKGKQKGECMFSIGNETRIKMRFAYNDNLTRRLMENNMSEFKSELIKKEKELREVKE